MAKKDPLIGKVFKLMPALLDGQGEPHPHAGEEITIIDRSGKWSYSASTADGSVIVVRPDDWGPTDAQMRQVIAGTGSDTSGAMSAAVEQQLRTINLYTDPKQNTVQQLLLATVKESPFNPRTNYPEEPMAEMAESARAVGITQPVLVRPLGDGSYELVFGHRRYRAAKMAALAFLPAIVRELTDAQSAQLQAVENSQRKDLDPIDEGRGFAAYIEAHGVNKDELCLQIGKSRTHVYNRLKLATLHTEGQKALRAGRIRSEVATLIARVPGEKHQAHALKLILDNSTHDKDAPEEALMTVRKARDLLREKFTLGLKDVIWSPDDADLLPSAGTCTACPKRSGSDPVLYEDLLGDKQTYRPHGANVCTDPACFDAKKTAQLKSNQAALEAKGKTVIAGNKARNAISAQGEIKGGYIALKDAKEVIKNAATKGKPAPAIATMTLQDPRNGKTVEVVKLDDVAAAGVKLDKPKTGDNWQANAAKDRAAREKREAKAEADTDFYEHLFLAVRAQAAKAARTTLGMQLIATRFFSAISYDERILVAKAHGCDKPQELDKKIGSLPADQLALLLLDCALAESIEQHGYHLDEPPKALLVAAKHYGLDVPELRKAADDAAKKAQAKNKGKTAQADAQEEDEEVDA